MKLVISICIFLSVLQLNAQDFARVDATIQLYPNRFETAEKFSNFINRDFDTDLDKVRAIYTWLISNVNYDPAEYKNFNYNFKNYRERNFKEEKTREKIVKRTLSQGVAVCEGYAMTFEKLCNLLGIPNYLVRGDIKTNFSDIGSSFKNVHMWNIATIDSKNYLFDATWGAGKYKERFIKEPTYFFFQTPPDLFIQTHYPSMFEDSLIDSPISKSEFASWPLIIVPDLPREALISPTSGIIDSELSDEIVFKVKIKPDTKVAYRYASMVKEIKTSTTDSIVSFKVPMEDKAENLLILFNDRPALGFKIK